MLALLISLLLLTGPSLSLPTTFPRPPSPHPNPNRPRTGVSVPLTKSFSLTLPSGILSLSALQASLSLVVAKFQLPGFPDRRRRTEWKRQDESGTGLADYEDLLWYGPIQIGSEEQLFMMDFDTGSADLFLAGSSCKSCGNQTLYDPSLSTTSNATGQNFTLKYGDGSKAFGSIYTDSVTVAGLTVKAQHLGAATSETGSLSASSVTSGLLGLAFPSLSAFNATPWFSTLLAQGGVEEGVFAFKLAENGSEAWFGGEDAPFVQGPIDWTHVTVEKYWQVEMESVTVGDEVAVSNFSAIIDTGTTLIIGTQPTVASFYSHIPNSTLAPSVGSGFYSFPCTSPIPPLLIQFAGASRSWPINPDYFNLGRVAEGSDLCVGGVVAQGDYPFWIIGDVWMKGKATVFDMERARFGVAALIGDTDNGDV